MKQWLQEYLVCPRCLPRQQPLRLQIEKEQEKDVIEGWLHCSACGSHFRIANGVAVVTPEAPPVPPTTAGGYNSRGMLSAYLWSHFADLFGDPDATTAYTAWASMIAPSDGSALDIGCSVGRLSFEMSTGHRRVIGIDTSFSFIENARRLLHRKQLRFDMVVEGMLAERRACDLPSAWRHDRVEFLVADAMALPFADHVFSTVTSINILEKVPNPLRHLQEADRALARENGLFAFSDPFSWDESVTEPGLWLGGKPEGHWSGRGFENMRRIFTGDGAVFSPPLQISNSGSVPWKIRKTANLWEHITSQYLVGTR